MRIFNYIAIPFLLITLIFFIGTKNGVFVMPVKAKNLPKTGIIMSKFVYEGIVEGYPPRYIIAIKGENNVIDMFAVEQSLYDQFNEKNRVFYTSKMKDGNFSLTSITLQERKL